MANPFTKFGLILLTAACPALADYQFQVWLPNLKKPSAAAPLLLYDTVGNLNPPWEQRSRLSGPLGQPLRFGDSGL